MSLRLLAGTVRGRLIEVPPGARPTEGRLREALASIWRDQVYGGAFLDLFAGSGAVGLEAWGMGASRVCFVERAPRGLAALRKNCTALAAPAEIVRGRLPKALLGWGCQEFDVVFADPPYDFDRYEELVQAATRVTQPAGLVAMEHSHRTAMPREVGGWHCRDQRRYGESCISFYRFAGQG